MKEETRKKEEGTGEKMRRGEKSRVKNRRKIENVAGTRTEAASGLRKSIGGEESVDLVVTRTVVASKKSRVEKQETKASSSCR